MYGGLRKEGGLGVKASPPMGRSTRLRSTRPSTAEAECRRGPPPPHTVSPLLLDTPFTSLN